MRRLSAKAFFFIVASSLLSVPVVFADCNISTTPLAFGQYASSQPAPKTGTGSVTVNCVNGAPYTIDLDAGMNSQDPNRRMNSGANYLTYQIYKDGVYSQIWGSALTGGSTLSGAGTGSDQAYTLYGKVPNGQNIPAGNYSDSVTATVTW